MRVPQGHQRVRIFTAAGGLFPFEVAEDHMGGCFAWGLLVPLHARWLALSETRSPRFCCMRNGGWKVSIFWWGCALRAYGFDLLVGAKIGRH